MARGGIYDHLGGGICRYSTDPEWLVPHFEKMLYDQALVSSAFISTFTRSTRNAEYAARGPRHFSTTYSDDLQSPQGGFYSTRDADSEGLEGRVLHLDRRAGRMPCSAKSGCGNLFLRNITT
jgi:uncharacterized protein YyaL (SSP411 family)